MLSYQSVRSPRIRNPKSGKHLDHVALRGLGPRKQTIFRVLACVEIKYYGAFVVSTCTPSMRRLLDGVAMPVPHRPTEPERPRHRREMT